MTAIAFRLWEYHHLIDASGRGPHTNHTYCRVCDTITTHTTRHAAQDAADAHQCDPQRLAEVKGRHGPKPPWSEEELEILRTCSIQVTAELTGRTEQAVAQQRHRLGITAHPKGSHNGTKTHCKRGHPLSGTNLHINPSGRRICRECRRLAKQKAAA